MTIFAYNTGSTIDGTKQRGDIAIGVAEMEYSTNPGGVKWWGGPDENTYTVIGIPDPTGSIPTPVGENAYICFDGTNKTDQDFIDYVNGKSGGSYSNVKDARSWLTSQGYYTTKEAFLDWEISAMYWQSMGLDYQGQVWSWGRNLYGTLGNNSTVDYSTPVSICGAKKTFCSITASENISMGIDHQGQVWSWGENFSGELGNNSKVSYSTPVSVCGIKKTFCSISAPYGGGFSSGIDYQGQVWSWGYNNHGELGHNNSMVSYSTPVKLSGVKKTFCSITGGYLYSIAIDYHGQLWSWGTNTNGKLGNNSTVDNSTPVSICGAKKLFVQ